MNGSNLAYLGSELNYRFSYVSCFFCGKINRSQKIGKSVTMDT